MTFKGQMFYADGVSDIRLGDRIEIARFLRRPLQGIVCYIPGQCLPHPKMQGEQLEDWAIVLPNGTVMAWIFLPGKTAKKSIKLIERGDVGDNLLKPDKPLY